MRELFDEEFSQWLNCEEFSSKPVFNNRYVEPRKRPLEIGMSATHVRSVFCRPVSVVHARLFWLLRDLAVVRANESPSP